MLLCWSFPLHRASCWVCFHRNLTPKVVTVLQYSEKHYPYKYQLRLNPSQTCSQERGRFTCDSYDRGIFEANVKSTPSCLPHDPTHLIGLDCLHIATSFLPHFSGRGLPIKPYVLNTDIMKIHLVKYLISCVRFVYCTPY